MAQEGDPRAHLSGLSRTGEPLPLLYSFRRCPYAMRARLAIAASGVQCELREVVLRDKPAALLAASPKGTVPVLVDGDTVIDQSLDIMLWALRQHDPGRWLAPQTGTLADMLALVAQCDGDFKRALDAYKYPERTPGADALAARAQGARFLQLLEARLQAAMALCGDHPALADAALAPFVRQFAQVDRAWFDAQPWPRLQAWLAQWVSGARFEAVMVRHPPWRAGTHGPRFPD